MRPTGYRHLEGLWDPLIGYYLKSVELFLLLTPRGLLGTYHRLLLNISQRSIINTIDKEALK